MLKELPQTIVSEYSKMSNKKSIQFITLGLLITAALITLASSCPPLLEWL